MRKTLSNKPAWIIIHHLGGVAGNPSADTSKHTFEDVNAWHKSLRFYVSNSGYSIGYHYFIDWQGKLFWGREDTEEGCHCVGKNTDSIGIGLAGNFSRIGENNTPSQAQADRLKELVVGLMKKYNIPIVRVVPHRMFSQTECYGKNLTDKWIQGLISGPVLEDEKLEELLRTKMTLIEKIIQIMVKIQRLLQTSKAGQMLGGNKHLFEDN